MPNVLNARRSGHLAKFCPQNKKKGLKRVTTEESRADEPTQEERPSSGEESNQETMEESSEMRKDPCYVP